MATSYFIGPSSRLRPSAAPEIGALYTDCRGVRSSDPVRTPLGRTQTELLLEDDIRLEERARMVHELHDTLLQGFLGASVLLDHAVEQTPADAPYKPALSRALRLVRRAIEEGRAAISGLHAAEPEPASLEQAFSNLLEEVTPGQGMQLRILVHGKPRTLHPEIQAQLFMIGREAVMNALRHSEATKIEVEVQYLQDLLRVLVRDNGCGIDPDTVQKQSHSHWGLGGMCERAENIGARFDLWSRKGAGTEVRVAVRFDPEKGEAMIEVPEGRSEIWRTPIASEF